MAGKKANKIPKTTIVQAGPKTSSKTVDKKGITDSTEKRPQKTQKTQKTVRSKSTAQGVSANYFETQSISVDLGEFFSEEDESFYSTELIKQMEVAINSKINKKNW